jgi:hypothetical protein
MGERIMMKTSISSEQGLSWLLARLTWPPILVRERACTELATLLLHPQLGDATRGALLHWIAGQRLESVAALGLLPFLRAKMQSGTYSIPLSELMKALRAPSILAWLLLNEVETRHSLPFAAACRHAETAPSGFTPDPFFAKNVKYFLPPSYVDIVRSFEAREGFPLYRQWTFEWQRLLKDLGVVPTRDEVDEWYRYLPGKEHYLGVDTRLAEVYRSAFLRALAWAATLGVAPVVVQFLAAHACPVDLDLWQVAPQPRPSWWPHISQSNGQIDTTPAEIWQQVEALWEKYRTGVQGSTIAAASGAVYHQEIMYDLEILGLFQACRGPATPGLADLAASYCGAAARDTALTFLRPSLLRYSGAIADRSPEEVLGQFADWDVLPAAGPVAHYGAVPRWQAWRVAREFWLPAPYLARSPLTVTCEARAIVVRDSDGEIGRWMDWTDGLEETTVEGLPLKSGQALNISIDAIEQFARQRKMTFCWLCQLTGYHREQTNQEFASFAEQRIFGASHILRL